MQSSYDVVSFPIVSASGSYAIKIGNGLLDAELQEGDERLFIVDEYLAGRFAGNEHNTITIAANERAKSIECMHPLIEAIASRRTTRNTTLVAVGGGVVQDCVTFAASIYMRGIQWIYVPTTLLSMVDSCIGGKSSINAGSFKNIIGTFHPPSQVIIDPLLAETLSAEQRIAGLCEAVKICICRGPEAFDAYIALVPSADIGNDSLVAVMDLCLRSKKWFIEIDEFDRNERLVLNFGHTFGHAIEAASGFAISHGIAVGLGMLTALYLGEDLGLTNTTDPRLKLFRDHVVSLLSGVPDLVEALSGCSIEKLVAAFNADKKHRRDAFAVIIVNGQGAVERVMLPRNRDTEEQIARCFRQLIASKLELSHAVTS
jgi:3-dehydroquinate synthase